MTKFFKKNNKSSGFTVIEALVAITIFVFSILGMFAVLGNNIKSVNYAKQKIEATYLAQEGLEYMRNQRDNYMVFGDGWSSFVTNCSNLDSNICLVGDAPLGFIRIVSLTSTTDKRVTVTSTVSWHQGSGDQNVSFSEDLFDWY